MREYQYLHFELRPHTSAITGRQLRINPDPERFWVSRDADPSVLTRAKAEWDAYLETLMPPVITTDTLGRPVRPKTLAYRLQRVGLQQASADLVAGCFAATTPDALHHAIEALIAYLDAGRGLWKAGSRKGMTRIPGEHRRLCELLGLFWRHELLAMPLGLVWAEGVVTGPSLPPVTETFYGAATNAIQLAHAAKARKSRQRTGRALTHLFLACQGAREIGDFDADVLRLALDAVPGTAEGWRSAWANQTLDLVRTLQVGEYREHSERLAAIPGSYRSLIGPLKESVRQDQEFGWARERDGERIAAWADAMSAYITALPNKLTLKDIFHHFNLLIEYVLAEARVPADPLAYCRRDQREGHGFAKWVQTTGKRTSGTNTRVIRSNRDFFDWLLATRVADEDGHVPREYVNPLADAGEAGYDSGPGQTHRHAIPTRMLRLMREILEDRDPVTNERTFRWAKSLEEDWIDWLNPETKQVERVWCPVRAYFYLLRLHLPIREFQVRMLDSGEGDRMVYRPERNDGSNGGWVENTGPFAPTAADSRPDRGFVHRTWDHKLGRWFNGLWVSTNKTADRMEGFTDPGYEIPWENPDILQLFCELRDWQEKYNPCQGALTRAELSAPEFQTPPEVAARLEKLYFLFRDAAHRRHPNEPVTGGRCSTFWLRLMDELERRLDAQGIRNDDGSKIVVVTSRNRDVYPTAAIFDPHSLRVSGLTALAEAGVPIYILSEFVAGHSTLLMTLYYTKPNAGTIKQELDAALMRMTDLEAKNWAAWVTSQPLEVIHDLVLCNEAAALAELRASQSGLWATLDIGVCPNSQTKCGTGGALLNKGKRVYGPVEGGPGNCVMCRHFVTGVPFLLGLVAKCNETGSKVHDLNRTIHEKQERRSARFAELSARWGAAIPPEEEKALMRSEEAIQKDQRDLEVLWATWNRQLRLIEGLRQIINSGRASGDKNALVLNSADPGDLRIEVAEASEFALWDRVCQTSEFFHSIDAKVPALRRGRLLDAALAREGQPAVFASLSDHELVEVGNATVRWLRTMVGDQSMEALVYGRETLRSLGIESSLQAELGRLMGHTAPVAVAVPAGALTPANTPAAMRRLPATTAEVM